MVIIQRLKQMLLGWGTVGIISSFCAQPPGTGL